MFVVNKKKQMDALAFMLPARKQKYALLPNIRNIRKELKQLL